MSLPEFPDQDKIPTREEVINQIVSSIAMEELGLSHIINAEGEKLQYALGTLSGAAGLQEPATMEDLIELNKSVHKTLDSTVMNQFFLKEKLRSALSASVMQGPAGPPGPQGPASIAVDEDVENLEPDAQPFVRNEGTTEGVILKFGIPRGITGPAGVPGAAATVSAGEAKRLPYGDMPTVINRGTFDQVVLDFGIPEGAPGPAGPTGSPGEVVFQGSIIPFSTLYPTEITTPYEGAEFQYGINLGMGQHINLEINPLNDYYGLISFRVPRDSTINAISCCLISTYDRTLDTGLIPHFAIYRLDVVSHTLMPIGVQLDFPPIVGDIQRFQAFEETLSGLSVSVAAGTNLLALVYGTPVTPGEGTDLTVSIQAGLNIL